MNNYEINDENKSSIYFIYSQLKDNILQINFKTKEKQFNLKELNLKNYKKNIIKEQNKNIISIFEISLTLEKLLKFYLEINTKDNKNFESEKEYLIKKNEDLFIYNLEFKDYDEKNLFFNKEENPPEKKQLTMKEQFSIFNEYLKEKGQAKIEKGSKKEHLINDTIEIISKNKNFDFDFFLCLFKETYFYNRIKTLLNIFNIKKINVHKNIELKQYEIVFKIILDKPNILLKNLDGNEILEKNFYDVLILFYKNFDQKYLFSLLFPDLNKIKKEEEKINLNKRSKIMINTILENPEKFSSLSNEIMKKLIDFIKDKKDKLNLLFFTKKLEIKLLILNETLDLIKQKIEFDPNSLEYNYEDNINQIFEYFFNILNYAQKKNYQGNFIEIKEEVWKNYADEYFKKQKIKNLYLLRKSLTKIEYSQRILNIIDNYIDLLGFDFIEKGVFKNKLIMEFLNNDFLLFEKQISKEKIDKITKCINFKLIKKNKDPFIQEYKNCKLKTIFKYYYEYFLQKMFSNIETMDSFYNIFKIYSPEDTIDLEVIKEMNFRFLALLNSDPNINNSIYFNATVAYLIEIFNKANNNKFTKKLLDDINNNNNLKKEKLASLYDYLILNTDFNSKIISENIIKLSNNPFSFVIVFKNFANNINDENINNNNYDDNNNNYNIRDLKILMEKKLNNKIIKEKDFLSKNSKKFLLLKLFFEADFFSDKFQYLNETNYIKTTKTKIEEILKKYENCVFTISEAFQLKKMTDLKDKFKTLFLNKDFESFIFIIL